MQHNNDYWFHNTTFVNFTGKSRRKERRSECRTSVTLRIEENSAQRVTLVQKELPTPRVTTETPSKLLT